MNKMSEQNIIEIQGVEKRFGSFVAVSDLNLSLKEGEFFSLLGPSGCGKTTTARVILRLIPATGGHVRFAGQDVFELRGRDLAAWRRQAQTIFQDPYGSLNPRVTVGASIAEGLVVHGLGTRREREAQVHAALTAVGLRPEYARRYPHEFSGGQRQRIGIARALVLQPQLIVCDEPVSALDVSVQAQVLNLLRDLQAKANSWLLVFGLRRNAQQHQTGGHEPIHRRTHKISPSLARLPAIPRRLKFLDVR